jgi:hypothetical protein
MPIRRTNPRQSVSCSRALRLWGSQTMPPFPPPSGMLTTAHFQVIHIASARTVSSVSWGWKRIPPLLGPRASLCGNRGIPAVPSSIRTGIANVYSRCGLRSRSRGGIQPSRSAMDQLRLGHLEGTEGPLFRFAHIVNLASGPVSGPLGVGRATRLPRPAAGSTSRPARACAAARALPGICSGGGCTAAQPGYPVARPLAVGLTPPAFAGIPLHCVSKPLRTASTVSTYVPCRVRHRREGHEEHTQHSRLSGAGGVRGPWPRRAVGCAGRRRWSGRTRRRRPGLRCHTPDRDRGRRDGDRAVERGQDDKRLRTGDRGPAGDRPDGHPLRRLQPHD